jgi:protein phosphatase 1 regulatory subunit 37
VGLPGVGVDEDLLNVGGSAEVGTSPVERASRAWVEEEGEIFRKGTKLGVVDDDEEESGEQLKQEVSLYSIFG